MAKADIIDFQFPEAKIYRPETYSCIKPFWHEFQKKYVERVFKRGGFILDIGGGLRIDPSRGNKFNKENLNAFQKYLDDSSVEYKVSDYTNQYNPDFVEDVHQLSFDDNAIDGIFVLHSLSMSTTQSVLQKKLFVC